ncbi:deleted in malignant brain tumors 1 protein-like [Pantherophis guttatus]|uniref:Deleted in malignant brain tumors 1 protein-like n=1 Tax=Pantherophis guttatus TaxID=94885 RepID=A0A6P9DJ96_PANGU|nr:deleted in malignant brain tumors 1 protein-like [Pantherophis guttatus]
MYTAMEPTLFLMLIAEVLQDIGSVSALSTTATPPTPGLSLRLAGTYNYCEGRVEVYYKGAWGTVCGNNWDIKDAEVVCQQLGCGNAVEALSWPKFGSGSGKIVLSDVQCKGDEFFLWDCKNPGWEVHNCNHEQDATVLCTDEKYKPAGTEGDVVFMQLVGGPNRCAGRVEVTFFANWRKEVCSEGWDIRDAQVVCNELYCGTALSALSDGSFGKGDSGPLMTHVDCSGSEDYLLSCPYEYRPATCGNYNDAAVICSDSGLTPTGMPDFGSSTIFA